MTIFRSLTSVPLLIRSAVATVASALTMLPVFVARGMLNADLVPASAGSSLTALPVEFLVPLLVALYLLGVKPAERSAPFAAKLTLASAVLAPLLLAFLTAVGNAISGGASVLSAIGAVGSAIMGGSLGVLGMVTFGLPVIAGGFLFTLIADLVVCRVWKEDLQRLAFESPRPGLVERVKGIFSKTARPATEQLLEKLDRKSEYLRAQFDSAVVTARDDIRLARLLDLAQEEWIQARDLYRSFVELLSRRLSPAEITFSRFEQAAWRVIEDVAGHNEEICSLIGAAKALDSTARSSSTETKESPLPAVQTLITRNEESIKVLSEALRKLSLLRTEKQVSESRWEETLDELRRIAGRVQDYSLEKPSEPIAVDERERVKT